MTAYAELAVTTNFSFLRGASHPQEMVGRRPSAGPCRHRHRRPQHARRRRARAMTAAKEHKHHASGRRAPRHHRRLRGRLPIRPTAPPTAGSAACSRTGNRRGQEGRMPSHLRGDARRERGPDPHRPAAATSSTPAFAERLDALAPALRRGRAFLAAMLRLSRRRAAPARRCSTSSAQRRGAPLVAINDVHLSRARAPAARRRAHLHPREMHDRRGRLPARGQCRAASEAGRRDGAAVRRLSRGGRAHASRSPTPATSRSTSCRYEYPDEPVPPGKTAAGSISRS